MLGSKRTRILVAVFFFLTIALGRYIYCWELHDSIPPPDIGVILCGVIALVLIDIYMLRPAQSHSLKSLIAQYIFLKFLLVIGYVLRKRFDKKCKQCEKQQESILTEILTQNKDTIFTKDFDLENVDNVKMLKEIMPLTTYENYRKYAEMIKEEGTENVLFPGKAYFLALTSGTTSGKSKMFPKNPAARTKGVLYILLMIYVMIYYTGKSFLSKWLYVKVLPKVVRTNSGIESGPVSATTYKLSFPFSAVPNTSIQTENEAMYVHLVFSLAEDNVSCLSTMVSTTALSLFSVMEKNWQTLCTDVEKGELSKSLNIPEDERTRLNGMMKPNPKRAAFLRKEFGKGFENIVARIWPECPCLVALNTGVFETPAKLVKQRYLGNLPVASLVHLGTESTFGINIHHTNQSPEAHYTPLITNNFFEFIPIAEFGEKTPSTLLAHQVEVGQMYEMVVTTFDGLYRYRTEDVVKIIRFYGTTPVYKFIQRAGDTLSAHLEKLPEFLLHDAVYAAAAARSNSIVEFTSCESVHVQLASGTDYALGYFVFIELQDAGKLNDHEIELVDAEICARHTVYDAMRRNNKLKPIKIVHLRTGAFREIKKLMLSSNPDAFYMQYKLPRIMRRVDILKAMLDMKV